MPKNMPYLPEDALRTGDIQFRDIPVLRYQKTVQDELDAQNYTREDLLRIYRDMRYIREFENMLMAVRTTKNYNGIEYMYTGPAHLYIGEELRLSARAICLAARISCSATTAATAK